MTVGLQDVALVDRVRALLVQARGAYRGPLERPLQDIRERLDEPLRVAVAGRVKSGKSTLINALLGQRVAATDAAECTRLVTWYCWGSEARAMAIDPSGTQRPVPWERDADGFRVLLAGLGSEAVDHLRVELPAEELRTTTLIDTPGIGSLSSGLSARTTAWLTGRGELQSPADAVIYLMRQVHVSDVDFLAAFRDEDYAPSTAITSLGVLSRIDEIGGGSDRSLPAADRLADRYRDDPLLRPLLQTVVPVACLLAEGSRTFTSGEYADIEALAGLPPSVTDSLLLSAARVGRGAGLVPAARRRALLARFGLFGLRLAVDLMREKSFADPRLLAQDLLAASGLPRLQQTLQLQFAERRDLIKADGAIRALQALLAGHDRRATTDVGMALERVTAGAHELRELQALHDLRLGTLRVPREQQRHVERLLGAEGASLQRRLGLAADASSATCREALGAEHRRWQIAAVSPATPGLRRLAPILQRTCEGLRYTIS